MTEVNVVNVSTGVSWTGSLSGLETLASNALGPPSPAQTRGAPFAVLRVSGYQGFGLTFWFTSRYGRE